MPRSLPKSKSPRAGRVLTMALTLLILPAASPAEEPEPIRFNTAFEGGSLGTIERISENAYRCRVRGQQDEHGRNRQASWYFFRLDGVRGRTLSITMTDFVGEYNGKPGACPMGPDIVPVYSEDGEHWQGVPSISWDDQAKEATITLRPERDTIWVAHQPPYTPHRLARVLEQVDRCDDARIEVIGKTVQGRDMHLITVSDSRVPDREKSTVWLQARQHAWESGTSFVMEGALRFVISDDARDLRSRVVFKFTPMVDPDGCANGQIRFNTNGFDVNRHWDEVDLIHKPFLTQMPEIWYVKKAITSHVHADSKVELLLNLHNTETAEYLQTMADDEPTRHMISSLSDSLIHEAGFHPSRGPVFGGPKNSTINVLHAETGIPVVLMEQRIGKDPESGQPRSSEDRLAFGANLIRLMAESALDHRAPSE